MIKQYLESMVAIRANMQHSLQSHFAWSCIEELVLKIGQGFTYKARPRSFKKGLPKSCYYNSAMLVINDPSLTYVEGYACIRGIPILHAWVIRSGSKFVIDVTANGLTDYYGIPFKTEYVVDRAVNSPDGFALLDDWYAGFPLLRMSVAELAGVIN